MKKPKLIHTGAVLIPGPGYTMAPDGAGGFKLAASPDIAWPASRVFGRLGGLAGKGKSKARDPKKMRAAAKKRWKNQKKK